MKMLDRWIAARCDAEIEAKIKRLAAAQGRTVPAMMRRLIAMAQETGLPDIAWEDASPSAQADDARHAQTVGA